MGFYFNSLLVSQQVTLNCLDGFAFLVNEIIFAVGLITAATCHVELPLVKRHGFNLNKLFLALFQH